MRELEAQFLDPTNDFDAKFAKKLAKKYLERAEDAAKGGYDVPMNLRSPEAADIVYDALKAMNVDEAELTKLMGKFARGGADFTKRRLKLNLQAKIDDGMVLRDLFNTDLSGLYRGYARRVAGEVSLAQYGIMGKKGLNELRKAITSSGGTADDMKAFDQIASEFLNTPFGSNNHRYMDNILAASQRSGVHATPHMFRHSAAVWMAEDRTPMEEIAAYLGHSDTRITSRVYARFSPDYLRRAAKALDW